MRMTEDQLTRDMLEATASVYNCTGGPIRQNVCRIKIFSDGLENRSILTSNSITGNKGQDFMNMCKLCDLKEKVINQKLNYQELCYETIEYRYGKILELLSNDYECKKCSNNQPERSKREDSSTDEMRCSEHCGNTVSEAQ